MPLTPDHLQQGLTLNIKKRVLSSAYRFFKTPAGGSLLQFIFSKASFILPVKRIWETDALLAFHHPLPAYPLHILLVPKRTYSNIADIPPQDHGLLSEMLQAVQHLVEVLELNQSSYRVILNGGTAQEINHLHIHLLGNIHD